MKFLYDLSWLYSDLNALTTTVISTVLIYLSVIAITRLNGLRTFAKMSSFDFAITIAIGSIIATTMLSDSLSVATGVTGLIVLIGMQALVAFLRKQSNAFDNAISNTPLLLMDGPRILHANMKASRITEGDLYAKLREANVTQMGQVLAVVLETTGDISVLHTDSDNQLSPEVLKFVRRE